MTTIPTDRAVIRACIDRCRATRDGRGRWQAEARCSDFMQRNGAARPIADACAAAARSIGTWLAGVRL